MLLEAPDLATLRRTSVIFNGFAGVDTSWLRLVETVSPGLDLARAEHRTLLLRWLNSWGCRIRYPRPGEPDLFDATMADWWQTWRICLPSAHLAELTDTEITAISAAYDALVSIKVGTRTLGPTAAAKALYALRPNALLPWDAAIAARLHGGRDGAAFAAHLRLGRAWAVSILTEAGCDERALCALLGRPVSLAKVLDEYLYVTITFEER